MTPEPVQLDPADPMARWLTRIAEHGAVLPGLRDPDPAHRRDALRQLSDRLAVEFAAPAPDTVRISDEPIERPDGSSLRLRRYLPERLTAPFPTQLWCHGGGFLSGVEQGGQAGLRAIRIAQGEHGVVFPLTFLQDIAQAAGAGQVEDQMSVGQVVRPVGERGER